jgi:D-amino-acid dehydrogenase
MVAGGLFATMMGGGMMVEKSEKTKTVAVVGAGVIGAAIALELQRRGLQVTLIDKGEPGRGTSYGNMASIALDFAAGSGPSTWRKIPRWLLDPEGPVWLRPAYALKMAPWFLRFIAAGRPARLRQIEDAGMSLSNPALTDFRAMLATIDASDLMTDEGCLAIYETEAEFAGDQGRMDFMRRYGFGFEVLSGGDIRSLEPSLSPSIAKAVLLPDNKTIRDPYQLVVRLADAARGLGATFVSGAVRNIEKSGDGTSVVLLESGERLTVDSVVLAAGVHTRFLAEKLGEPIPLETERGYHTQIMQPGVSMRYSVMAASRLHDHADGWRHPRRRQCRACRSRRRTRFPPRPRSRAPCPARRARPEGRGIERMDGAPPCLARHDPDHLAILEDAWRLVCDRSRPSRPHLLRHHRAAGRRHGDGTQARRRSGAVPHRSLLGRQCPGEPSRRPASVIGEADEMETHDPVAGCPCRR